MIVLALWVWAFVGPICAILHGIAAKIAWPDMRVAAIFQLVLAAGYSLLAAAAIFGLAVAS